MLLTTDPSLLEASLPLIGACLALIVGLGFGVFLGELRNTDKD